MMDQPALRPASVAAPLIRATHPRDDKEEMLSSTPQTGYLGLLTKTCGTYIPSNTRGTRLLPTSNADCKEDDCHVVTEKG